MNKIFKFIVDLFVCKNLLEKKEAEKFDIINIREHKISIILFLLFLVILYFMEPIFKCYFIEESAFKDLKTFLVTISAGLVGLTAIIFTLIIFSMQTNLEKLPFGLFKNFSSDKKLMFYLGMMLTLSILIGILSLVQDSCFSGWIFNIFLVSIVSIYFFIYLSFKRGLKLINPLEQLNMIIEDTKKNLNFEENIHYVDSIIKRNLNVKEYEVSAEALNTLIIINEIYIQKKDKDNHEILEKLRINFSIFLKNYDEIAIEQILSAYVMLAKGYDDNTASSYLIYDIEKLYLSNNSDLLMKSIKKLEEVSIFYIKKNRLYDFIQINDSIGKIGKFVCLKQTHIIIVQTVMNAYCNITKELLDSKNDIQYACKKINEEILVISKSIIESSFINSYIYEHYLGNYYSYKSSGLLKYLLNLKDELLKKEDTECNKKLILDNILIFTSESYYIQKELFEFCLKNKSLVLNYILLWIEKISYLLMELSKFNYKKNDFFEITKKYLYIISFIPEETIDINYISLFDINEELFKLAKKLLKNKEFEVQVVLIIKLMIRWSFKVAKYKNTNTNDMVLGIIGASCLLCKIDKKIFYDEILSEVVHNIKKYILDDETKEYIIKKLPEIGKKSSYRDGIYNSIHEFDENRVINFLDKIVGLFNTK
jgi:hypothetical protein